MNISWQYDHWHVYLPGIRNVLGTGEYLSYAIKDFYKDLDEYKKRCEKLGKEIPVDLEDKEFSGQFNTRIDPNLHKALVLEATRNHVSLNTFVTRKLKESIKEINYDFIIDKISVEKSSVRKTLTLYFYNEFGTPEIGLSFMEQNLWDELDVNFENINDLADHILNTASLKKVFQDFIISYPESSNRWPLLVDCGLASVKRIGRKELKSDNDYLIFELSKFYYS